MAVAPIYLLWLNDVPLGESGKFIYRYSPFFVRHLQAALLLLPIAGGILLAGRLLCASKILWQRIGVAVLALVVASLAAWTWWAPPNALSQHAFNLSSPAHDGAFVIEAQRVGSINEFLRTFDQSLHRTVEEMRGTRVLSNPPGTTLLAVAVLRLFPPQPADPKWIERAIEDEGVSDPAQVAQLSSSIRVGLALTILWAASAIFAYLLGRLFLSPLGAGAFTLLVLFNPATVCFTPGKDPVQLFTINAMLWAWFAGWRKDRPAMSILAGAFLVLGMVIGLIHLWVAMAAILASAWQNWRQGRSLVTLLMRHVLPCMAGALFLCSAIAFVSGWNIPATLLAVGHRFPEIQKALQYDRTLWFFIGLPLFLLFLSGGFWAFAGLRLRHRAWGFGASLLAATVLAMLATYLLGITYELPRLWVAFVPLLLLAAMADQPLLHGRNTRRALVPVMLLVIVAILATGLHWSIMDARETEYRVFSSERMFW